MLVIATIFLIFGVIGVLSGHSLGSLFAVIVVGAVFTVLSSAVRKR